MNINEQNKDSFKYWGEYWLSKKKNKVSYSQYRNLKCYLNHIYDFIGDIPINEIKPDHIDDLLDQLTGKNPNTKRPASHQYLIDVKNAAFDVFESAIDHDIIAKNPARRCEISKFAPIEKRRSLTAAEQLLIICTPHRARIGALIMMLAGLRRGELIPLTWDDIDLDSFKISITKSVEEKQPNRFFIKEGTKNGKWGRIVGIPLDLAIEIESAKKVSESKFVCCKANGMMHSPTSWRRMWDNYISTIIKLNPSAMNTGIKDITAHYLRHTYATLLYISGVPLIEASKLLGHANIKTTANIYTHLDELMVAKSVDKFDEYISSNLFHDSYK